MVEKENNVSEVIIEKNIASEKKEQNKKLALTAL